MAGVFNRFTYFAQNNIMTAYLEKFNSLCTKISVHLSYMVNFTKDITIGNSDLSQYGYSDQKSCSQKAIGLFLEHLR